MKLTKQAKQDFFKWIKTAEKYKEYNFTVCPLNGLMMKEKPINKFPDVLLIGLISDWIATIENRDYCKEINEIIDEVNNKVNK